MMIAPRTVAAEPIVTAAPLAPITVVVSAKPTALGTRAARKTPVGFVTPLALVEPARNPRGELVQHRWPSLPLRRHLSMSEQVTERLTEIGNRFNDHLDLLSRNLFQLKVDGLRRRAHLRIGRGGGDDDLFTFQINGDIQFHNLNARVDAHIDLGFDGHLLRLDLPAFQVQADEYRGDHGVQLEVPVFEKRF